ncbi:MAG: hypothetical protein NZ518_12215, partial [Dehalococcoidia bacterium]|nr:hypothetical protein [Dehalococcoidia bacterium]
REAQVLAALSREPVAPSAIVPSIYPDLDASLVELAGRQVTSILRKLERDGVVTGDGEGENRLWRLRTTS